MGRPIYLETPGVAGGLARRILAALMAIVLIGSAAFGIYLKVHRDTALDVASRFQDAMAGGRYEEALASLRAVQAKVAGANVSGGGGSDMALYRESLASMEKTVTDRVDAILAATGKDTSSLREDDRGFLEGMGELTGMLVSARLRALCSGLLTGTASRTEVDAAFLALGSLTNLSQPTKLLKQELDAIQLSTQAVANAEKALTEERYFDALDLFGAIASETSGFVQEYALGRVQNCKETMLAPLSEQAGAWLDSDRYYSARDLLNRLKAVFPENTGVEAMLQTALSNTAQSLEAYSGPVEHITVRPLVVTPSRAFDGDDLEGPIAQGMLTVAEFRALLDGLYARGYVLIDIGSMLDETGQAIPVFVPPGKKPLILTLETVNYYAHRAANGLCSNLVIDGEGHVSGQYLDESGALRVDRQAEAIGILETFVEEHPDFSFDGAKGILSLTGYECVFGYVLNKDQLLRRNENNAESGLSLQQLSSAQMLENTETVKDIAVKLLAGGWRFASSTYAYLEPGDPSTTLAGLEADAAAWNAQIGALVGGTDILMYPNGSFLSGDDPRCQMYRSLGFRFFAGIGPQAYVYYRENYVYMDKTAINGFTMAHDDLSRFFDVNAARDPARPG